MIDSAPAPAATMGLTSDAWATLVAAFIGAAAALIVVVIRRLLEGRDRTREENGRKQAIATALLFEIDNHYRSNIRDLLNFFEKNDNDTSLTVIKPMSANPFPVYVGNASVLGALPPTVVEAIVHYYGELRGYVATLSQYSRGLEIWSENNPTGRAIVLTLVPKIKKEAAAIPALPSRNRGT
jgi:hypothetical protein